MWRSILASEDASDIGDSDSEEDFQDTTVALGQLTQIQTQIQMDDSQDPEYRPSLEEELSSSSNSEESVIAPLHQVFYPQVSRRRNQGSVDLLSEINRRTTSIRLIKASSFLSLLFIIFL